MFDKKLYHTDRYQVILNFNDSEINAYCHTLDNFTSSPIFSVFVAAMLICIIMLLKLKCNILQIKKSVKHFTVDNAMVQNNWSPPPPQQMRITSKGSVHCCQGEV